MTLSPELSALGRYLAGEFDNRQQALAEPAWYVHLHLWQRPTPLFAEDSITLFLEQANVLTPDKPYRQRLLRLRQGSSPSALQADYYMFKNLSAVQGAAREPERLQHLTPEQVEFLPGCTLEIQRESLSPEGDLFRTLANPDKCCSFTYQEKTYFVSLGFEVTPAQLRVYDKGIDPKTGKALWGALLGPFCFSKHQDFSRELPL
ncbi:MAG: chromophore lyase CpcT/CpeT [Cyanobacteriota bacterium]|nr:chromophore lyase CpcT/CpeT [Cyanobacteriota bacterium]